MNATQEVYVHSRRAAGVMRPGDEWIVGSATSCDLRVADSGVMGRHCRLRHLGPRVRLESLHGLHPARIGGAEVEAASFPLVGAFQVGSAMVRLHPGGEPLEDALPEMVGASPAMIDLAARVRRVARWELPVLLRGESGTGKDLVARAIHALGARADHAFVAINGAGLDPALAASALFGHARGAFTGASTAREGALRRAHRGTLFIDEVASLAPQVQATLLRVLEEGVVHAVGADDAVPVDLRIVAATCEDLERDVERGRFRRDLYQRLAASVIRVPPLRERVADIEPLARQLLARAAPGFVLSPEALQALERYRFPGNVRELRNVICQAALVAEGGVIADSDVDLALDERNGGAGTRRPIAARAVAVLAETGGNISAAARRLGVPRSTFRDAIRRAQNDPATDKPCVSGPSVGVTMSAEPLPPDVSTK
jgi:DNA-binding NtrC family response regulator